ncbi:retrovirus-related pol polyprotein from transposon TNT 1-94 [Tanacetum coccineum]
MDLKSSFRNGFINEEVYVAQPLGFIDFEKPDHIYKLKKALYGLKQAPKAWYDRLKAFLIKHEYKMGMVDNTLFTKKKSSNLIIVQIYLDDIKFGLTCQDICNEFAKIMHDEFGMSMMSERNFFLGLQIKQIEDGIFFNQSKYIKEMLKKFGLEDSKPMKTPMSSDTKLMKDEECGLLTTWKLAVPRKCMTRSSISELFTPYEEPEPEFQSSRKHFKTLSLDELRSLGFNLFSYQEDYSEEEKKQKSRRKQRQEAEVAHDETEHEESVPTPSNDPLPSGEDSMQLNDLMNHGTKRLKKVGAARRIESSNDGLGAQEDASKQGRRIKDIDADAEVFVDVTTGEKDEQSTKINDSTVGEAVTTAGVEDSVVPTTVGETLAQTLMEIKAAKPRSKGNVFHDQEEQVTMPTVSISQPSIKDKGKGIMQEPERPLKRKEQIALDEQMARDIQAQLDAEIIEEERLERQKEEEANIALIESWENTQAMMEVDRLLAERLQIREREELADEEKGKLFMELMEKRRKHFAALRAQEKRNRPPTKAQKRTQMSTYLKHVAMGSEVQESNENKVEGSEEKGKSSRKKSLGKKRAVKEHQQESPKRQKLEDDKETDEHEEVEADDKAELKKHLVIKKDDDIAIDAIPLATKPPVIGIDREDLLTLWKLVKTKHGDSRPENEHERVLWGDFKVMFVPYIRSKVWRDLQGYTLTVWKLYDSCGVHFVRNLKIQKMNIKFRGGLLGLKRLQGFLLLLSTAGTYYCLCSVSAAGYKDTTVTEFQLLEDLLLSKG